MTRVGMLRALGDNYKAEETIFWFAYAWHTGKNSDLYRILRESPYTPPLGMKFDDDPEIIRGLAALEQAFGYQVEMPYTPVKYADVQAGDVLIAGAHHLCLVKRWPCRVVEWEGNLAVACKTGMHRLRADEQGFVVGFRW